MDYSNEGLSFWDEKDRTKVPGLIRRMGNSVETVRSVMNDEDRVISSIYRYLSHLLVAVGPVCTRFFLQTRQQNH
jgi:hypothetical protein